MYSGFNQIAFDMGAELTDGTPIGNGSKLVLDPQVRLAIAQATDRQVLADKVYGGFANPGTTVIPPLYTNLHLEPENQVAFDLDAANATLDHRVHDGRTTGCGSRPRAGRSRWAWIGLRRPAGRRRW